MTAPLAPDLVDGTPMLSRSDVVDAAARAMTRRGNHQVCWMVIAGEIGDTRAANTWEWSDDALIDECYARTAQGLSDSLLRAETAPGTALDKLAAFLVAALEIRRGRGTLLSFRRGGGLPLPLQRRLHEHDTTVRMRLRRLLNRGRRDGSLALRNLDSAVELLLASLQAPSVVVDGPGQRMWDSELVELLLAALAEPHPPEAESVTSVAVIHGSCMCGSVRYDIDGPFEIISHCHCSMCRRSHGAAFAKLFSVPLSGFRWVAGEHEVSAYQSTNCGKRTFCAKCGSVTPVVESENGVVFCPAGNSDRGSRVRSTDHRREAAARPAYTG